MSSIVIGIVISTIGLLCNKLRDYTAQRLKDGDISNSKLRQIIVREIDDIKTKLDGLSRKDLLASLSFFKDGVTQLCISLETYGESCEKPSTSQAHTEDDEPEGAIAMINKQVKKDVIDTAFDLHKFMGNLEIASEERYQSAKKSLEEAKRLATEAFSNTALSTDDRVMAGKLRIASRILGCLDDPDAAVHSCLLYLNELHDLPAVQAMFTVWQNSKKGFTSDHGIVAESHPTAHQHEDGLFRLADDQYWQGDLSSNFATKGNDERARKKAIYTARSLQAYNRNCFS